MGLGLYKMPPFGVVFYWAQRMGSGRWEAWHPQEVPLQAGCRDEYVAVGEVEAALVAAIIVDSRDDISYR